MIIGLTGGIASGKSTVSKMLKDEGIPVIDADIVAREVVQIGEEAYEKVVNNFGIEVTNSDGTLDRKKLGAIVFNDEEKRSALNEILHPVIRNRMENRVGELKEKGYKTIVLDIPLLFESKLTNLVDKIILVYIDEDLQRKRLQNRDQFSDEEVEVRLKAQFPLKEKIKWADEVIHNHGLLSDTKEQLVTILIKWNCLPRS
ncbi:dephospho-CoA kinase [Anaerobacillus alkalidiazotrophicus]|uniref:Dephospho-CoA kinase n=1 Tax=Anaerobacillus alkalidiazotrophicus TaxID=472963 RepID=A0A1S2M0P5_9BACI|nr:dephospho-CoA kinase [Anaerobacillus alkalidiazotrophicus]OIJ18281.1 dephospho-CoA kinase [Anaerobacillus alkalidiazotrophicus]OIJ19760.1 dephospho-CoA kinase [Anaerobacillus alkalidiazotrophicus]